VHTQYICDLRDKKVSQNIGSKAQNLRYLIENKFKTPKTFVCTWDAHKHYLKNDCQITEIIKHELSKKINKNCYYAIRSSTNIEDGHSYSFAGQFKSILNVKGLDNIIEAIESIWSSTSSKGVKTYLKKVGVDPSKLKMAVIIQEMVNPTVSGVSFSRNPLSGMD